jgi:hypothetical protein
MNKKAFGADVSARTFAAITAAITTGLCDAWVVDDDGAVVGEVDGGSFVDVDGETHVVGRGPSMSRGSHGRGSRGRGGRLPPHLGQRPSWDQSQHGVSPGPDEYMWPLPLTPSANNGVFTAAVTEITYEGEPQKPYKGERIVSIVARSGASAAGLIPVTTSIFVGTDLQQAQQGNIPVEFWPVTAFGVRMHMKDAKPGVDIELPVILVGGALAGTDTLTVLLMILGRNLA